MEKVLVAHLLHLIFVLPIIALTLKNRTSESLKILLSFSIFFIGNSLLLALPGHFPTFRIFEGQWNWDGKLFAILGAVVFLLLYRKFELKDYYLTLKQDKKHLKKGIIIISAIFLLSSVLNIALNPFTTEWNWETLMFQLSMPGINEEIAYRGIMLGLLAKILKPNKFLHPAIIVTAILFGLGHGFFLDGNWEVVFNAAPFFGTFALGMIWAWITMKTGSILLALISHNLGNVADALISMCK